MYIDKTVQYSLKICLKTLKPIDKNIKLQTKIVLTIKLFFSLQLNFHVIGITCECTRHISTGIIR